MTKNGTSVREYAVFFYAAFIFRYGTFISRLPLKGIEAANYTVNGPSLFVRFAETAGRVHVSDA